ncbi:hypothetical protein [Corynebacterium sp. H113]|uniref:hypothetical protein n=1 Tax=Corynebacterium sp. H113 TaxID=3133419 RepID=UPI0030A30888
MDVTPIVQVLEAMPDGPTVVVNVESPFPALESFAGEDVNITSTVGDINMPFGQDAFDITVVDSHDTAVSDIVDVNAGNGVVADIPAEAETPAEAEAPTEVAAPEDAEAPAEVGAPTETEAPAEAEAPADAESTTEQA